MRRTILSRPQIIGYRKDGRPIYLIQGGSSAEGGGAAGGAGGSGSGGDGKTGDQGGDGKASDGKTGSTSVDQITDVEQLQALVARLQGEAAASGGKAREQARAAAAADAQKETLQTVAKALGIITDEKADPKALQSQIEQLTAANTERDRELAIYRAALGPGMNVNAGKLLDSRAFMRDAAAIDPTSDTATADIKALITAAVTSDPSLMGAPGGGAGSSVEHPGGAGDNHNPDLSKLHGASLLAGAYAANESKG